MASSISNTLTFSASPLMKATGTQTTTPTVANTGTGVLQALGIARGYSFGGKKTALPQTQALLDSLQPKTAASIATPAASSQNSNMYTPTNTNTYTPPSTSVSTQPVMPSYTPTPTRVPGIVPAPQQATPNFPSTLTSLVAASKPNSTQKGLVKKISQGADQNTAIGENARRIAETYGNEIADVGKLGAGAVAGDLTTGTNVVGSGNAAIASQSASQRMSALATAEEAALQGTGQQLTGTQQMTNAFNQALGGANTQQAQTIGGIGTAAGLTTPSVAGYGQTVFDPTTGTFGGGSGNLDPQSVASQLAQDVISGNKTYEQAIASLGYAGGAGQQFLNNALKAINPSFNAPLASAQVGGQSSIFSQLPQLEAADTAASGVKNKITTYLAQNPQLNPADLAVGNKLQQWIQGKQLTDPKYQSLFNYLNEYTNTLAPILGVGGDPTNLKTQIAQSFINAAASGQSIATVLDNMQALSQGKILDIKSGALGGGVVSSPATGSGTGSGGLYDW